MARCPECNSTGRKVRRITLESLLRVERHADIGDGPYHVCTTPGCETVYFAAEDDAIFTGSDLTVRFGLKETGSPRPVCYCFDHTMEDIEDEIRRTGRSTIIERITGEMKKSGCRCEYTNPLGGCCLKSVQTVVAEALALVGDECPSHSTMTADCCGASGEREPPADTSPADCGARAEGRSRDRAGVMAVGGSVLAAVLSSACCWLPLLLIAFGASAVGVAGFFEAYRPYLIACALVLLGTGFYRVYLRREKCEPGSSCASSGRGLRVLNQVALWAASALVGAFIFFPNYMSYVMAAQTPETSPVSDTDLLTAEFHIEGMTCEGCASRLRAALVELPDVESAEVDYPTGTAVVHFKAGSEHLAERVIDGAQAAGFHATSANAP